MTEPPATKPARVCVIVPQDHHQGQYVNWCKTHRQPASFCMNNVFPVHEGGGEVELLACPCGGNPVPSYRDSTGNRFITCSREVGGRRCSFNAWEVDWNTRTAQPAGSLSDAPSYIVNCHRCGAKVELFPTAQPAGEPSERRSNHFSNGAVERGAFPAHISKDGKADYQDAAQPTEARERASITMFGFDYDEVWFRNRLGNEVVDRLLQRIAAALSSIPEPVHPHGGMTFEEEVLWRREREKSMLQCMKAQGEWIEKLRAEVVSLPTPSAELKQRARAAAEEITNHLSGYIDPKIGLPRVADNVEQIIFKHLTADEQGESS